MGLLRKVWKGGGEGGMESLEGEPSRQEVGRCQGGQGREAGGAGVEEGRRQKEEMRSESELLKKRLRSRASS